MQLLLVQLQVVAASSIPSFNEQVFPHDHLCRPVIPTLDSSQKAIELIKSRHFLRSIKGLPCARHIKVVS